MVEWRSAESLKVSDAVFVKLGVEFVEVVQGFEVKMSFVNFGLDRIRLLQLLIAIKLHFLKDVSNVLLLVID